MAELLTVENALALVTLTALEIVLGVDNIVLIAILTGRLPERRRPAARRIGLAIAMLTRIALLLLITVIAKLTAPLFELLSHEFNGRDLVLIGGGLFLIAKATHEVHENLEGPDTDETVRKPAATFAAVIAQIVALDLVFSLDSVITAVGMAKSTYVMITAVVAAVGVMFVAAGPISRFIERHPTIKMLALAFMLLIGVLLVADGFGRHIERGYVYFAMGFSLAVELLNLRVRRVHAAAVRLKRRAPAEDA